MIPAMAAHEQFLYFGEDSNDDHSRNVDIEFPSDPRERYGRIISSAINHGPKAALLMLFSPYGEYDEVLYLADKFRDTIAGSGTPFDTTETKNILQYCLDSLEDIGLVARSIEVDSAGVKNLVGFGLTEAGAEFGPRAASLMLRFVSMHEGFSMYREFGKTQTTSKREARSPFARSPYSRARMLLDMYEHGRDGWREVTAMVKDNPDVLGAVIRTSVPILEKFGLIEVEHRNSNPRPHEYGRGDALPETWQGEREFIRKVAQACLNLTEVKPTFTMEDVADMMYPEFKETWKSKFGLAQEIRKISPRLSELNVITRVSEGWQKPSLYVRFKPLGMAVVEELLKPLDDLLSNDRETSDRAKHDIDTQVMPWVLAHLSECSITAVQRYYPFSHQYRKEHISELDNKIIRVAGGTGEIGERIGMIAEELGENKRTVYERANFLVRSHVLKKRVVKIGRKKEVYYVVG